MNGMKQSEVWKSTSVAEQCIEDSVSNQIRLAKKALTRKDNLPAANTEVTTKKTFNHICSNQQQIQFN